MLDVVLLSITEKCNYNCKHCRAVEYHTEINFKKACQILEKIKRETKAINLTGGEPLLYSKIIPLIKYIKKKTPLKVYMSTNAYFLTPQNAIQLKKAGLDGINISLDSTIPQKHDSFRGKQGAYKAAERGIKIAVENGLNCRIVSALGKFNYQEVGKLIIKAIEMGCSAISLGRIFPISKALLNSSELLNKNEVIFVLKEAYKFLLILYPFFDVYIQEPIDLYLSQRVLNQKFSNSGGCSACRYSIEIKTNGDVWPCPFLPIKIGNIYENSIKEILKNPIAKSIIKRELKGECNVCSLKQVCGGCRAWALFKKGNLLESDPYCLKNKRIVEGLPSFEEKHFLDKEEVKEILALTTKFMKPIFEKSGIDWKSEILEKDLKKKKNGIFWLLKFKSRIVGYLWLTTKKSEIYLKSIIIDKPWQKKYFGFLLIKRLELFAKKRGKKQIRLAIQKANKKSLNFFKRLGYKKIGKEEDLILLKRI